MCQSVCLSVCEHSHGRISWSIFTKIGIDVSTPKRKNDFVRGQYGTNPTPILPHKTPILGQKVLNPMQILSNPMSALNVRESPKFSRPKGNRDRGTRWWRQIFHRKWKYGHFAHAQWKICNITLIYGWIAQIFPSFRKSGSRNTMVTSDFSPEVEIRPFRARAMHPAIIIGTVRSLWTWLWGRYHVPQNAFLVSYSVYSQVSSDIDTTHVHVHWDFWPLNNV